MLRLMIVDDEEIIRTAISKMIDFTSLGYELIATAKNGMEAFDIICDSYPDVIITDIKMPILNGLELIERAYNLDIGINYIILSGYGEFEYAKQAMKYGVQHFLLKPTNKQELINALIEIHDSRNEVQEKQRLQQQHILQKVRFPMEQCFLMESLEWQQDFSQCFQKYDQLLSFPSHCLHACICTFIEDNNLNAFLKDINKMLEKNQITQFFPIISVKNTVILIINVETLNIQTKLQEFIENRTYPSQAVSFQAAFMHFHNVFELYQSIIEKISRFSQILLIDSSLVAYEIRNNLTSPWRLKELENIIKSSSNEMEFEEILNTTFSTSINLEAAKKISIELFLMQNSSVTEYSLDMACDFFRKIYSCTSTQAIYEMLRDVLSTSLQEQLSLDSKQKSYIPLLKNYVNNHLDAEYLSLKWLAENYLYISVGYLSKQFVKEEGERFSDYLNRIRMEEAKKLLAIYSNDNIKSIAKQVGFGNSPHYFSQVFKKYVGCTPSEFWETSKTEHVHKSL
ncbi:response regulator [Lachnotalea glycerini]|uniref:Stage 0 sporulation protein A homolog n=1 Tax=Lachnotalea glycerini TaxID=1763509 RepID=A0A371JFZ3_9FIRM|nr:response regulator [Lachnotalea glycerini]RDY31596.1 response regulator [Lachnotalea glycerini]